MWFIKDDPQTVYLDIRRGKIKYDKIYRSDLINHEIKPTIQADNRYLPFKSNVFDMVLYDPPQVIQENPTGAVLQKYGVLNPITWTMDMSKAIKELFRVLKSNGFFIFKWSESRKALKEALQLFPSKILFGTNVSFTNKAATWWVVFRK